ncbi:MAG TPA: PEP-CTERM sorting domain-containing protein [Bryobacteraceae bacterium]|nr:PEP-CTERM sorting domain-containing protein [Bryobacteraceae bacterium]
MFRYRYLAVLALVLPLSAGSIFVTEGSTLYTVDSSTLAVLNTVTLLSPFTPLSMAQDPLNGLLYANDGSGSLYTIDSSSGNVNSIGTLAAGAGSTQPSATSGQLAFNSAGGLYLMSSALTGDGGNAIYGIDPSTGYFTSTSTGEANLSGFAFNPVTGTFEGIGSATGSAQEGVLAALFSVDPSSGTSTYLMDANGPAFLQLPSLLTVDASGILYAECNTAGSGSGSAIECPAGASLASIDGLGLISQLGDLPGTQADVIAADLSNFAPEPSAVILMLSGMAGLFVLRKKIF